MQDEDPKELDKTCHSFKADKVSVSVGRVGLVLQAGHDCAEVWDWVDNPPRSPRTYPLNYTCSFLNAGDV